MRTWASVVLEHRRTDGAHFDWMVENPLIAAPAPPLATWRVDAPPADWTLGRSLDLTRLGDHRRAYLSYEGPMTQNRGEVHRIDVGSVIVRSWTLEAALLRVYFRRVSATIELSRLTGDRWLARVIESSLYP
ncbi:MAG: hypothetical protein GC162_13490 [Planctomycetes bacterium]|nr:hypothetical protein [Planctomycetota bacterium]